jgi:hypothetical protein
MGQQLAAVRLRLDNLLIKQSIFDYPEPGVNRTKDAPAPTCGDAVIWKAARVGAVFWPVTGGAGEGGLLPVIATIFCYGG